jgi:hypothetical protein
MPRIRHALILLAVLLCLPATAGASGTQEAWLQDNSLLISNQSHLDQTLSTLRLLGVQRLRISVGWGSIAPSSNSRTKPSFNANDPGAYPAANWAPYDRIVSEASKFGMAVNFDVMGPAPLWATRANPPSADIAHLWYPSVSDFGQFAHAVGTRYSGHYTPSGASSPAPRVTHWSLWNEPNVGGSSLAPQTVNGVEVSPQIYRGLVDNGWSALQSTGHGRDTILVGEMASTGHADPGTYLGMQPLRFLRALFCVDSRYRQLRGAAAAARGCPTDAAGSRGFRAAHPALFNATAWSHHPYRISTLAPNVPSPKADPDWVTFADLPKLERALDRVQRAYGSHRRYSIYLTEYGYNSHPPQSFNAVNLNTQAAYLNQAEYMAWHDPRVKALSQYLLQDAPFTLGFQFSAFASGLVFHNGKNKPSFYSYRLPLWLPRTRASRGRSLEVWGGARPAFYAGPATHTAQHVNIQFQRGSRGAWKTLRTVSTNARGYFDVHITFPGSGSVRLVYTYPAHASRLPTGTAYSRHVQVTIR